MLIEDSLPPFSSHVRPYSGGANLESETMCGRVHRVLRKSWSAFSELVTWPSLYRLKQTFLVPLAPRGLISRAALTLMMRAFQAEFLGDESIKQRVNTTDISRNDNYISIFWLLLFHVLFYYAPAWCGRQMRYFSLRHLKELVGVSAILLAVRCHPSQDRETLYDSPAQAAGEN